VCLAVNSNRYVVLASSTNPVSPVTSVAVAVVEEISAVDFFVIVEIKGYLASPRSLVSMDVPLEIVWLGAIMFVAERVVAGLVDGSRAEFKVPAVISEALGAG
jgi:hypothetical protein